MDRRAGSAGKKYIHRDCDSHCNEGFRHSLSRAWASGQPAWLSRHVLGVKPIEPIHFRHERRADGSVKSAICMWKGLTVVEKLP